MKDLKAAGYQTRTIRKLLNEGRIVKIKPGLYRLEDTPLTESVGMVDVCLSNPKAVICLVSALVVHELTTQNPSVISFALPRSSKPARLDYPPTHPYYFSEKQYHAGIEHRETAGGPIRIYNMEKSVCDMFRYRNKLGLDIALEVRKNYFARPNFNVAALMGYATLCRVHKDIMKYSTVIVA